MVTRVINKVKREFANLKHYSIVRKYNKSILPNIHKSFETALKENTPPEGFLTKFSDVERAIEILPEDQNLKKVVFTCYFTKRVDPQSGILRSEPDYKYIKPWYESMVKLDIHGIIIHDGIDKDFINKYETEKIQFREYKAGKYAIFDERWLFYYLFIKQTNIEYAFCTDLSDVFITHSPFERHIEKKVLYMGRDNANKIRQSQWILNEINIYLKDSGITIPKSFYYQPLYNVGVFGGDRAILLFFLSKVIEYTQYTETERFKEMTVFNIIIHKYLGVELQYSQSEATIVDPHNDKMSSNHVVKSGYPLNSMFKGFEFDSKATFIHK